MTFGPRAPAFQNLQSSVYCVSPWRFVFQESHIMDDRVIESYRWCRKLCRRSGSSFCWTFVLLPREQCNAMYSLYAFARITDDLADGEGSLLGKRKALSSWLALTESLEGDMHLSLSNSVHRDSSPLWPSLKYVTQTYDIPRKFLTDIVDGVIKDLDHAQPSDWKELDQYCYLVASAVGLACTRIWRADKAMPQQAAIDCGIAFQLTNILRDVANDARLGRIYIPANEFARFGLDASSWLNGAPNGDWRSVIRSVARRAEELYASGWNTIKYLPPPSRRLFSLMWRYYHALLLEVLRNVDRLWEISRTRIPRLVRARLAAQHFIPPLYWSLPNPVH